jgi:hypothetical protein
MSTPQIGDTRQEAIAPLSARAAAARDQTGYRQLMSDQSSSVGDIDKPLTSRTLLQMKFQVSTGHGQEDPPGWSKAKWCLLALTVIGVLGVVYGFLYLGANYNKTLADNLPGYRA